MTPQVVTIQPDGQKLINGIPQGTGSGMTDLRPVGHVSRLPGDLDKTGPLGPLEFLSTVQQSEIVLWRSKTERQSDGTRVVTYSPQPTSGADILKPGNHPQFAGIRSDRFSDKLNFISLMLALFAGTASLPHILIRYYTVKDQASGELVTTL